MTDIQKSIRDGIRGISYDMQNTADSEKLLRMAEAIKIMVEAYNITTRWDGVKLQFATGGLVEKSVKFTD